MSESKLRSGFIRTDKLIRLDVVNDQNAGERKGIPIALDPDAKSADPGLPAFLARPEGAPLYHGFPVVEGVEVEGFRIGMLTDFASSPDEGDTYVITPDGSRGGLSGQWETNTRFRKCGSWIDNDGASGRCGFLNRC
jgi:hypothetical protein